MTARRFPIRLDPRFRLILRCFGLRGRNEIVELDGEVDAHLGAFRVHTPLANVTRWRIEGRGWP